jgi:hypothetical protein
MPAAPDAPDPAGVVVRCEAGALATGPAVGAPLLADMFAGVPALELLEDVGLEAGSCTEGAPAEAGCSAPELLQAATKRPAKQAW